MATKSQEILLKGNTTNASAVPSSLKVREIAINALDRSLFTNDGNSIVKLYTGTTKWFDVNGNANNALKLGGILASEYINKEAFNSHINNSIIHITAAERTAWNNKWDYDEKTIKGVKVNAAISADKATKLATARKIWGQSFDGSGDISGSLNIEWYKIYWNNDINNFCIGWNTSDYTLDYVNYFGHKFYTKGVERLRITSGGNILIGTTTDNGYKLDVNGKGHYSGDLICGGEVVAVAGEGTPAGVTDYSALTGKPAINGVTLVSGNNTLAALGIQAAGDYATNSGVATLLAGYADKTFVSNNYVGKSAFNAHTADTDIHITSAERVAWNAKWTYDEATIKAVKVTSASSADSVAWTGIANKPSTFTPSAHTHTASEVSGLPTSLKNPYKLTFGSKTYDGSAAATITASDLGALTSITKPMIEGVLTGNITSHTHSYLPLVEEHYNESNNNTPLVIKGIKAGAWIAYRDSDSEFLGSIGVQSDKKAYFYEISLGAAELLHSGNYNSYAPTLTGTGASGTWGISISGNAATADVVSKTYHNQSINFASYDSKIRLISSTDEDAIANGFPIQFAGGISAISGYVGWQMVTYGSTSIPNPYFRKVIDDNTWEDWKQLAFLTDNVASATKLQTPRSIWGQSFDGSANVWSGIDVDGYKDVNSVTKVADLGTIGLVINASTIRKNWGMCFWTEGNGRGMIQQQAFNSSDTTYPICLQPFGGNILIGTTTDNAVDTLQVNGSIRSTSGHFGQILINKGHGDYTGTRTIETDTVGAMLYINYYHNGGLNLCQGGGNVLIGTTTDNGYKLQVNGSERVYGDLIVDGEVSALVA